MTDAELIDASIKEFPKVFGLKGFPGMRFNINASASYVSQGTIWLYTFNDETGKAFCKGTVEELKREVIP